MRTMQTISSLPGAVAYQLPLAVLLLFVVECSLETLFGPTSRYQIWRRGSLALEALLTRCLTGSNRLAWRIFNY